MLKFSCQNLCDKLYIQNMNCPTAITKNVTKCHAKFYKLNKKYIAFSKFCTNFVYEYVNNPNTKKTEQQTVSLK